MIIRKAKRSRYTTVDNGVVNDERLSFKALGMLLYLLSKPDHWNANYRHLMTTHTDGESSCRSALAELETVGYITREKVRTEDGTFRWELTVHEEVPPCGGFPGMDNPGLVTTPVVSTEVVRTEQEADPVVPAADLSLPGIPPGVSKKSDIERRLVEDFEAWYSGYPRKVGKGKARSAYKTARAKVAASVLLTARDAFAALVRAQGTQSQYVKMPATWLNQECWDDDLDNETTGPGYTGPEMRFG